MKSFVWASAMILLGMSSASAAVHKFDYTMRITSLWLSGQGVESLSLPTGQVAVGDMGSGSFSYSDAAGQNTGYGNFGYAKTKTFTTGIAPSHQFQVGTMDYLSTSKNEYTLWDSYDSRTSADSVTFQAWINSANNLQIVFHDVTASHLPGIEQADVGTFPLEHYGTFSYFAFTPDGVRYSLEGTLLTVSMDGGPVVNLPPLGSPGPVPEPTTYAMFATGALVLFGARRRKQA